MRRRILLGMLLACLAASMAGAEPKPAEFQVVRDWEIRVRRPGHADAVVQITPTDHVLVAEEKYDGLPVFNPNAGGWVKGAQLTGVRAQETTTPFLLDPYSLTVRSISGPLTKGKDYEADLNWGTIGRLAGGSLKEGQAVWISYVYYPLRLDSIVLTRGGKVEVRRGQPKSAAPSPPPLAKGERLLANVWLPGRVERLTRDNLFPVLEDAYPEPPRPKVSVAETLTPKALAKLRSGQPLRILAWGDSVTVGTYVPDYQKNRWQEQFVARLKERFRKAKIELVTEAWGGRNTGSYLAEPPGAEHNYREKVLALKPDLVVSEFVNDAGLSPEQVEERYGKLLADFQAIGAEWIILTPHYVRPDWMGLDSERDIDEDPRPYVKGLREFGPRHKVAIADPSLRYGRLWRQGLPYTTLLLNSINHSDARGMQLFADALMELFPAK